MAEHTAAQKPPTGRTADGDSSGLADITGHDFRQIVDSLHDGLIVLDRQLRCRYINVAAARLLGRSAESSLGASVWDICADVPEQKDLRKALERTMKGDLAEEFVCRRISADQWIDFRVMPLGDRWSVGIRDISGHRQFQLEHRNFSVAFTHSADPALILDYDGVITVMNEAAVRAYRCEKEPIVGQSFKALVPRDLHSEANALLERCRQGEQLVNVETRLRRMNGEIIPVLTTLSLVDDDAGAPNAMIVITKDISELKKSANTLLADRHQLARNARLIALGEMAAGLAHELNQPLSAIAHYCDAALSVAGSQPVVDTELVGIIRESYDQCQRAGDVVRTIRDLAARRQQPRRPEDLNAIVASTIRFLMPEIRGKHIDHQLSLAEPAPVVLVDKVEIEQVIINLVLNSIEAMDEANCSVRKLFVSTSIFDGEARVKVQDTGPGVNTDLLKTLFEPFQTDKEDGLGLGLWISRSILEAHDGRLWIENSTGDGATFCIGLPLPS